MSEKIVKYEYEYGLCKRMHYRGLWCVRYEGVPGHFEKAGMALSLIHISDPTRLALI